MMDAKKKASKTPKAAPVFPRNLGDVANEMTREVAALDKVIGDIYQRVFAGMQDRFDRNGGCKKCGGRGWVVTWDTLDYMDGSAHETGACPNPECTEVTRKASGLAPKGSKYDGFHGVRPENVRVRAEPAFQMLVKDMEQRRDELKVGLVDVQRIRNAAFKRGEKVVVVKGRKMAPGTVGYVAYVNNNTIHGGLLLKSTKEAVEVRMSPAMGWVNANNVERVIE